MHVIDGITYLTTAETAARLGLSIGTLSNQRTEHRSPMKWARLLGAVVYPLAEVERYAREIGR
ncbi:hypothetical protein ACPXB1_22480 [Micromonospora sp. DT68]|uniref:hypothetical protein n=1 Tax=Micromonospora TaxID=1873 RepID=UPI0014398AB7|nr:hypothetical protein [Micromonospora profundi]NJC10612.1 hypothetical protein [Micromonospora profundi]